MSSRLPLRHALPTGTPFQARIPPCPLTDRDLPVVSSPFDAPTANPLFHSLDDLNLQLRIPPVVLVVDDDKAMRTILRRLLEKEGYQVLEASNGSLCVDLCHRELPDIILMDGMMPGMDGFTCCEQLQQGFGEFCPPILMVTTLDDEESVNRAFAVGATDYITKPVHWAVLRQRVRRLIQSGWAMAELLRKMEKERLLKEQLEIAYREVQRLATQDGLTGLFNRRTFDQQLRHEWKRLARERLSLSVILCDIDFFKAYNDTYGHQSGDECIRQVAAQLRRGTRRPADLCARYGGEEFVVLLPNTEPDGAIQVAEAVRSLVRAQAIPHERSKVSPWVSMSFGVAGEVPRLDQSPDHLISRADQALYQAKGAGRDRVVGWQPSMAVPVMTSEAPQGSA